MLFQLVCKTTLKTYSYCYSYLLEQQWRPGDLPDPGIEPTSPTLQADALTSEPPGKPSLKPYSQKSSQSYHTRTTALSNSMKPSHAHGATQDKWVMVERSDRLWSTGEGNGKPLQYSCLENPMNSMKRQNDRILKEVLPRSVGAQYATGSQWRNNSRKNEGIEPKQK